MVRITLLSFVMLFLIGCSSKGNNWPYPMTPFFAECEYEGKVFVDKEYIKRKSAGGCKGGKEFKYYDRGEPVLTND
jgi:hypothetical protein